MFFVLLVRFLAKLKGELLTNAPFARVFAQGIAKENVRKMIFLTDKAIALIIGVVFLMHRVPLPISGVHFES